MHSISRQTQMDDDGVFFFKPEAITSYTILQLTRQHSQIGKSRETFSVGLLSRYFEDVRLKHNIIFYFTYNLQ